MAMFERIHFGLGRKLPLFLQTETTECGLACLGMIAGYHGDQRSLAEHRRLYSISLKGANLANLIRVATQMGLQSRPLKLDMDNLPDLRLPCILHWNFNHFVVLKEFRQAHAIIHDPGFGVRKITLKELSNSFTGVALELWPNGQFQPQLKESSIKISALIGRVSGLMRSLFQVFVLALSLEVFTLLSPFFLQLVIDDVIVSVNQNLLNTLAIGFLFLMITQQVVTVIRAWIIMYMNTSLSMQWRANVFSHLVSLPNQYFEKRNLGDVVSRFGAIDQIQKLLTTSFLEALLDGIMTMATLSMMFLYSPNLAWIAVCAMAIYTLGRWLSYSPLRNASKEQIVHAAKQQSHFLETMRGIKAIKLFQRQEVRRVAWLNLLVDQINADLRTQKLQALIKFLNGVVFGVENILIIWLGAKLVLAENFTVGVFMAFNSYRAQFDSRIGSLVDKYFEMKMLQLYGERLSDIVMTDQEVTFSNSLLEEEPGESGSLKVKDLQVRYSDHDPCVLKGISFQIEEGESVAIVGPSGCGKTTMINVLLGILPATKGDVYIGGTNVRRVGVDSIRRVVGTVLQDDVLFAGSIFENISFFDQTPDQEWVQECARLAAVDEEIREMPMGYNTLVGDMGTVLSGGQKQRVLLARALYKRPKMLFLDEATSHLDIAKERQVNNSIRSLQMTRIIVAHRPETIASADRIIELREGKIFRDTRVVSADSSAA